MILKLINHSEEYAVREITASFFPKEKFEYKDDIADGDYVISEYKYDGNLHTYSASCSIMGKCGDNMIQTASYSPTFIKKNL